MEVVCRDHLRMRNLWSLDGDMVLPWNTARSSSHGKWSCFDPSPAEWTLNTPSDIELARNFVHHIFISFPFKIVIFATMYRSVSCTCCNNVLHPSNLGRTNIFNPLPTGSPTPNFPASASVTVYRRMEASGWWWWRADWGVRGWNPAWIGWFRICLTLGLSTMGCIESDDNSCIFQLSTG